MMAVLQRWRCLVPALLAATLLWGCAAHYEFVDEPGRFRGSRVDGEQSGPWTYFYADGSQRAQGEYRADRLSGEWTFWFPADAQGHRQKQYEIGYRDGHLQGAYRRWDRSGNPRARGFFEDGLESGSWTFFAPGRLPQVMGDFVSGRMQLRWIHRREDGRRLAEGYRLHDEMVGPWRFWDAGGQEFREDYDLPPGWELVRDLWPGGAVRREGFLLNGRPQGLWVSWHRNGSRRCAGSFEAGQATGLWALWDGDGALVGAGQLQRSALVGDWTVVSGGDPQTWSARVLDPPRPPTSQWSDEGLSGRSARDALSAWLGEMLSPALAAPRPANFDRPPPEALARAVERPAVTVPPQPWRAREISALPALVRELGGVQPGSGGGPFAEGDVQSVAAVDAAEALRGAGGQLSLSTPLVGKPLPVGLVSSDDVRLDLGAGIGHKVALVIMRGFDGEVCAYCAAQTRALERSRERFEALGVELLVVFPGDRDDLDTFLAAVASLDLQGTLPRFTVGFDPVYELVDALDIRAPRSAPTLPPAALPTTLLLDEQGVVRWAYVGRNRSDRPDVETLLAALEQLGRR